MKLKYRIQGLLVGIIVALIFSSGIIYAVNDRIVKNIAVTYRGIKLSIDGEIIKTDTEPFIYKNRTFVPIRFIVEHLNMDIKYNEITDTVEMTRKAILDKGDDAVENKPTQSNEDGISGNDDGSITSTTSTVSNGDPNNIVLPTDDNRGTIFKN